MNRRFDVSSKSAFRWRKAAGKNEEKGDEERRKIGRKVLSSLCFQIFFGSISKSDPVSVLVWMHILFYTGRCISTKAEMPKTPQDLIIQGTNLFFSLSAKVTFYLGKLDKGYVKLGGEGRGIQPKVRWEKKKPTFKGQSWNTRGSSHQKGLVRLHKCNMNTTPFHKIESAKLFLNFHKILLYMNTTPFLGIDWEIDLCSQWDKGIG